jgi:ketosteroid isomerase-like protein
MQDLYEAFGRGEVPAVLGAMDPGVEWRQAGNCKETGKSLDAQVCHVWKLHDGKITSFQQYVDTGQWQDVVDAR